MARKTVYRRLIGKWGVLSIQYQNHGDSLALANQMKEEYGLQDSENNPTFVVGEYTDVDVDTGEVVEDQDSGIVS